MNSKSWSITDVSRGLYLPDLELTAADLGKGFDGCTARKKTLRGGLSEGVDAIDIDNGHCQFTVLPTRGMAVWRATVGDVRLGWQSPVIGPVHPQFVSIDEQGGLGFLAGFDELVTRCGLRNNGAPELDQQGNVLYPLHGLVGNRPAHRVEVFVDAESGDLVISGEVDDSRFHLWKLRLISTIRTRPGEPGFRISDRVINLSAQEATAQMLYHVNYGRPLLEKGSRLVAPIKTMSPRDERAVEGLDSWEIYEAPDSTFTEQCYFCDLIEADDGYTQIMLHNANADRGVRMRIHKENLPYFTVWKNTVAEADGYVTGLEPGTNFPNGRIFETDQGRIVRLAPYGAREFNLEIHGLTNAEAVQSTAVEIGKLQRFSKRAVHDQPLPEWCGLPPKFA